MNKKQLDILSREIERLLLNLALNFINIIPEEIDKIIEDGLRIIADYLNADRCYIYLFEEKSKQLSLAYKFNQKDIKEKIPQYDHLNSEDFAWLIHPFLEKQCVKIDSLADLPQRAGTIKAIMEVEKTQSAVMYPLFSEQPFIGFIGIDFVKERRIFTEESESILQMAGKIFTQAIQRKERFHQGIQNEQRLRKLFSEIEDVVFISTPEGRFLEINPAGVKLLGYSSLEEVLDLNIEQDIYYNPENREKYQQTMITEGQIRDYELVLKNKNGKKIIVLETATVVRDEQGRITAYQGILRDVTYKRQLEHQLFQAKKMESVGMLAGGIAHDFNNILTTISGYAELIMMDTDATNKNYDDLKHIIDGVKRAEDLIRQLLAFSRRQMIEPKIMNINSTINDLLSMMKRLISEDIQLDLILKQNLDCIKADPIQIQQILVNLVINAGYAVKQQTDKTKGKKISIITDQVNITKKSKNQYPEGREGEFILIAVQDTGIGMNENTKQSIFEPFFSTKKEGEGTGLGLSTVFGIVKQNNGIIFVESEPGEGSTFKILWPITKEQTASVKPRETQIQFQSGSEMLLYVEDDASLRELFCNALKSLGYQVIEAENGKQALEIVKKQSLTNKIDLVISDIVMPEMGGEELAECLKKLNPAIKILLSSGFTDSRISLNEANRENGYYFLPKPYTVKKLEKTIRSILSETL